ncbi:hypothetical protein ABVK25_001154 [Lepraria finkii]|uniref:Uncharacterized protein n=1 Tax=Lepraria finkii TaxID=1340010 RepID=A0ABR4BNL9_9LECA
MQLVGLPLDFTQRKRIPYTNYSIPLVLEDDNSTLYTLADSSDFGVTTLYVNIYGPESLFDATDISTSDCALFLQDPQAAIVRSCIEALIECHLALVQLLTPRPSPPEIEEFSGSLDPFHDPELAKDLPETESAEVLKTRLYPYQNKQSSSCCDGNRVGHSAANIKMYGDWSWMEKGQKANLKIQVLQIFMAEH